METASAPGPEPAPLPPQAAQAAANAAPFDELCAFLGEYVSTFVAFGGQTVRVERSALRLGLVFGVSVEMLLLYRHAVVTVAALCDASLHKTIVVPFKPIGHNFSMTFGLNKLSWEAFDDWRAAIGAPPPGAGKAGPGMTMVMGFCVPEQELRTGNAMRSQADLARLRQRFYDIIQQPRLPEWMLCPMIGVASASFCSLFAGDWLAMGIVFFASQAAFIVRRLMLKRHMDVRLAFLAAAFVSSFLSAAGTWHVPSATPATAVASSILFLVPGVPLLSAVNDILNGHTLMGLSRGTHAAILTLCIAFGLVATLMVTGFNVL